MLSGFLITLLLLQEKSANNSIAVRRFYMRRILRIWPAYYMVILISIAALYLIECYTPAGNVLWCYLFFLPNIPLAAGSAIPALVHLWSIGVEEQFYATWPWLIKKVKNLTGTFISIVLLYLLLKFLFRYWGSQQLYTFWYYLRFDCMAIGGIGALLVHGRHKLLYHIYTQPIFWIAVAVSISAMYKVITIPLFKEELYPLAFLIIIINVSTNPAVPVKLNHAALRFLGKISYGIYLYHPLMIYLCAWLCKKFALLHIVQYSGYVPVYLFVIAATMLLALASYRLVEQHFLKLKKKYAA